ncbi:glycosyltransferase family 2 protein [Deinococcus ruber]|uniref:Rhamnosyltransferase n=1 Tax=Deinococcus ruber TaxID=1848197 RepID=A0A918C682_9DEIO|nr:glycosyltransferase family 2 protein [Deinococcus ruber]GGR08719.1 rhamnosyltransferase [Deinococcus ruber]
MKVAVLLSSYNGEKYISHLIETILGQTYKNFDLYIRDDGSKDFTLEKIEKYKKLDKRVHFVESQGNLGSSGSFLELLYQVEADVYFFADQDDSWLSNKIETFLDLYIDENNKTPVLMFSDLEVVDDNLNIIDKSFFKYQNINPIHAFSLATAIAQNSVTGCAMMINRELAIKMCHFKNSKNIIMHDWLALIIANLYGKVIFIEESTIKYRQHSYNVIGAKPWSIEFIIKAAGSPQSLRKRIKLTVLQANEIYNTFITDSHLPGYNTLKSYASILSYKKPKKLFILNKYGIKKSGMLRNLAFRALI